MSPNPVIRATITVGGAMFLATLLGLAAPGCDGDQVLGGGDVHTLGGKRDVRRVEPGMSSAQVRGKLGSPRDVIYGEGAATGMEVWIYPTGRVFIYRQEVERVTPDPNIPEEPAQSEPSNRLRPRP